MFRKKKKLEIPPLPKSKDLKNEEQIINKIQNIPSTSDVKKIVVPLSIGQEFNEINRPEKEEAIAVKIPKLPPNTKEVERLLREIRDFEDSIRDQAVIRLGQLMVKEAIEPLKSRMKNDKSPKVRAHSIEALYQIGDQSAWSEIVNILTSGVEKDASVRLKAVEVLGKIGDPSFFPVLSKSILDPSEDVRNQVCQSLKNFKTISTRDLKKFVALLHNSSLKKNTGYIVKALISLGPKVIAPLLDDISKTLQDNQVYYFDVYGKINPTNSYFDDYVKNTTEILEKIGLAGLSEIIQYLNSNRSHTAKIVITEALGRIRDKQSIDQLCWIVKNEADPLIRWIALAGLSNQYPGNPEQIDDIFIYALQQSTDWILRLKAAQCMSKSTTGNALKPLWNAIIKDDEQRVRNEAQKTLCGLRDVRSVHMLGMIVMDGQELKERVLAANILGDIGLKEALDYLIPAMGSEGEIAVRKSCARALGKIKDRKAVPYLNKVYIGDPSEDVRNAAKDALAAIR